MPEGRSKVSDKPTTLFDALPRNVIELAREADRAVKAGKPDYLPAVLCQVGLPRSRRVNAPLSAWWQGISTCPKQCATCVRVC